MSTLIGLILITISSIAIFKKVKEFVKGFMVEPVSPRMQEINHTLMKKSREFNPSLVQILLEKGADANILDEDGETLLTRAASGAPISYVKMLLENGAKVDKRDSSGRTPLLRAAHRFNNNAFTSMVSDNLRVGIMELLLENGADINAADKYGKTALGYALQDRSSQIIQFLMSNGAQ